MTTLRDPRLPPTIRRILRRSSGNTGYVPVVGLVAVTVLGAVLRGPYLYFAIRGGLTSEKGNQPVVIQPLRHRAVERAAVYRPVFRIVGVPLLGLNAIRLRTLKYHGAY